MARPSPATAARRPTGTTIGLAVVVALLLRLAFAFGYWIDQPLNHDEREYLELAGSLATGLGFHYPQRQPPTPDGPRYGRAPAYPAFLAAVQMVAGPESWPRNIRIAQCLVGALTVWWLALVARRAAGPPAAEACAWLAAVYPPFVWMSAFVLTEGLFIAIAALVVLNLGSAIDGLEPPSRSLPQDVATGVASGLLAGVGVLVRPALLFFLLLTGLWLATTRRWALLTALTVASLLVVGPWTVRNYREYGRPILVASEGGLTFWTGNHPLSPGEGDLAANPAIKRESNRLRAEHPGLTEEELELVYYREAFRAIAADPVRWGALLVRKAFHTIVPVGPSYSLHSRLYRAASIGPYLLVLPLGLAGLVLVRRRGTWPRAQVLLASSSLLVGIVFFPQERFRLSGLDPTLVIGAAAWWALRGNPPGRPGRLIAGGQ